MIFPIHIIELLTFALVLLGIYRVFRALSFESNTPDSQHVQYISESKSKLDQKQTTEKNSTKVQTSSQTAEMYSPNISAHQTSNQTSYQCTEHSNDTSNQVVLKNYIGDFF